MSSKLIKMKKSRIGIRTNNQEMTGYPAPQIRLRTHVQKTMYINFIMKISVILLTGQL